MASTEEYVIAVENNGVVEDKVTVKTGEDPHAVFAEMYRTGYAGDVFTLYAVHDGYWTSIKAATLRG